MALAPLQAVQFLPIGYVANQWSRENQLNLPRIALENELRRYLFALRQGRDVLNLGQIPEEDYPANEDLPGLDDEIGRNQVEAFAEVKGWNPPVFWFPEHIPERRPPGRPSFKPAIVQEFVRKRAAGEIIEGTVTEEAEVLRIWMNDEGMRQVQKQTIVKWLKGTFDNP